MGRPIKLTPDVQSKICEAIRVGATREIAAQAAGISRRTLQYWIERGKTERERLTRKGARKRKREERYLHFLHEMEKSEAKGEVTHLETIADQGPAGSKWILSRRHPDRWARLEKQELSGPGGGPISIRAEDLTDDELAAIAIRGSERTSETP